MNTAGKTQGKGSNNMKMNCAKVKRMLSLVLDGEAPAELRAAVEDHLERCAGCRKEFQELKEIKALLQSMPSPEMPSYLTARVLARLQEKESAQPGFIPVLWRIAAALLIAIGLGLGVVIGQGLAGNGGTGDEIATLNAEPTLEEFFGGGR